jgi:hypothetical protein
MGNMILGLLLDLRFICCNGDGAGFFKKKVEM